MLLGIVSSTTSHTGAVQYNGSWYLTYHTADATSEWLSYSWWVAIDQSVLHTDGGHFRRSVAFDQLLWDDAQSPPRIKKVVQTKRAGATPAPTRNVAPKAVASSVNATPIQYWVASINNGKVPTNRKLVH